MHRVNRATHINLNELLHPGAALLWWRRQRRRCRGTQTPGHRERATFYIWVYSTMHMRSISRSTSCMTPQFHLQMRLTSAINFIRPSGVVGRGTGGGVSERACMRKHLSSWSAERVGSVFLCVCVHCWSCWFLNFLNS